MYKPLFSHEKQSRNGHHNMHACLLPDLTASSHQVQNHIPAYFMMFMNQICDHYIFFTLFITTETVPKYLIAKYCQQSLSITHKAPTRFDRMWIDHDSSKMVSEQLDVCRCQAILTSPLNYQGQSISTSVTHTQEYTDPEFFLMILSSGLDELIHFRPDILNKIYYNCPIHVPE